MSPETKAKLELKKQERRKKIEDEEKKKKEVENEKLQYANIVRARLDKKLHDDPDFLSKKI